MQGCAARRRPRFHPVKIGVVYIIQYKGRPLIFTPIGDRYIVQINSCGMANEEAIGRQQPEHGWLRIFSFTFRSVEGLAWRNTACGAEEKGVDQIGRLLCHIVKAKSAAEKNPDIV